MPEEAGRRKLLISKAWVQASVVVFLLGFFVLGLLAYRTYTADPPIPDRGTGDLVALSVALGLSVTVAGRLLATVIQDLLSIAVYLAIVVAIVV